MLTRRDFLRLTAASCVLPVSPRAAAHGATPTYRVRAITSGPRHHFFGYYGIPPWSQSAKYMACLQTEFQHRPPQPHEAASICLLNLDRGTMRVVGETRAWNVQQGAMLHWNPLQPDSEIIFNDRNGDDIISVILNVHNGRSRKLPMPVAGVSHNGKYALCLDYGRLMRTRPVVGYSGAKDPNPNSKHPDNDGVFLMDLETGRTKLLVSIAQTFHKLAGAHPMLADRDMFFNHTVFSRDDGRFLVLARCFTPERRLESAMFTANLKGGDLREVVPFGLGVSHFEWRNGQEILATFRFEGDKMKHVLFSDGKQDYRSIGEGFLAGDGHCSFAPDQSWIVTDQRHDDTRSKSLLVYNVESKEGVRIGSFPMKEYFTGDLRCDLHPRWDRAGRNICFDALETTNWTRQLHIAERV